LAPGDLVVTVKMLTSVLEAAVDRVDGRWCRAAVGAGAQVGAVP
jgi:hypothetical protein